MTERPTTATELLGTEGFGAENLPYGSCRPVGSVTSGRLAVRLGDHALDVTSLLDGAGPLTPRARAAVEGRANLDALLATDHTVWTEVRAWLRGVVTDPAMTGTVRAAATPLAEVETLMPFTVADYVDFYASENHASNIGRMFRPDDAPLKPNWKHLPVGYHGRSSTIVVSGTDLHRPKGLRPEKDAGPSFGPSRRLDIEAELGFVCGGSAPQGEVSLKSAAEEHLFGVVLFNDWSARDIQAFEYVPLGPNLGKSFASSISAWVVPWEALGSARVPAPPRDEPLAPYLDDTRAEPYGLDIALEVLIDDQRVSTPPASTLYWTAPQMVAHMTVNNATLRPGDFLGSGTVSGTEPDQRGSLIELTWGGARPLTDATGEDYSFLRDGQRVTLRGTAPGPDGSVISFGECTGTILPAT
ncbi:fumarylacetoacetase [Spiractinospora alimapuensis]|uniref:fumarylacetoacetase n=1 Tax=Spiractinospora alimapuensis TaxID=2820884 RepID=UPI001F371FC2|nr:fumarylacetoacetase [Spiractinospora alimapuensis]QVQ51868.1 fumarylacetoacetase [Spiractinospora alimapuensis]